MTLPGPAQTQGAPEGRDGLSLSAYLTRLIWLCVLPLMLLAAWMAYDYIMAIQADSGKDAARLAGNTAVAVDHNLWARIGALQMLALSSMVDEPARWPELYREAQGFQESFGSHVIFAENSEPMRMLFNTLAPYGAPMPQMPRPALHAAAPTAAATGRPAVGDTFIGPIAGVPLVAIAVPALRGGRTSHLMLTAIETRQFQQRLDQQVLPEGWALSLLDGRGEVIARRAPTGFDGERDVDASGRFAARSALSPWSVVVEIPREIQRVPVTVAALALGTGVLGATLIGVLGGILAGRRLGKAVAVLTGSPREEMPAPRIAEIAVARRLLDEMAEKRTAAEDVLRKFSRVIEQTASTVVITDAEGVIEYVNPRFTETSGYAAAEAIGRRPSLLKSGHTTPEDYASLWRTIKAGGVWRGEFHNRRKDGTLYWESATISPIRDGAGRITHFTGIKEDITARKEMESALRRSAAFDEAALKSLGEGLYTIDGQGLVTYMNPAAEELFGWTFAELLGRKMHDAAHHHYRDGRPFPSSECAGFQVLTHGRPLKNHEDVFIRKDGTFFDVMYSIAPLRDDAGAITGLVVVFSDITERKRTEAALKEMHAETEQLMKQHVASQTTAAIAHELNQPLIAVASYAEAALRMLRAGNPQPDRLQYALEGSAQQAQRAGQVVRELLAFLNVSEVQTEPVDLNAVVRKVLAGIETNLPDDFQARLDLAPGLATVSANQLQVEKVLANLIQNGIEAMRDAGVSPQSMTVAVRTSADGSMAQVTVRDSGPGIDAQAMHRIFDPFFTTKAKGLGMGLAISRAIIEAHGGQLWLELDPGPGATFHFTLPFHA